LDARALELALRLPDAQLEVLHAGDPGDGALRAYLGMGLQRIDVLAIVEGSNPYPALLEKVTERHFDLIMTGTNNIDGANTGLLPYALAKDLSCPVIGSACDVSIQQDRVRVLQSLPKGRRRLVAAQLPAVVTVGTSGPSPRQIALGPARRGTVGQSPGHAPSVASLPPWTIKPAKSVPQRLQTFSHGASASERLAAIMDSPHKSGEILTDLSPKAAAEALLDYLVGEGVLSRNFRPNRGGKTHDD